MNVEIMFLYWLKQRPVNEICDLRPVFCTWLFYIEEVFRLPSSLIYLYRIDSLHVGIKCGILLHVI